MNYSRLFIFIFSITLPCTAMSDYFVETFSGSEDQYKIIRDGKLFHFMEMSVLKPGDIVAVKHETGSITLSSNDSESVTLTKASDVFVVPEDSEPPGIIDNLWMSITSWFDKRRTLEVQEIVATTREEGEPFLVLGVSDINNLLLPEEDSLVVHWVGDRPPYQVRLLDGDDRVVVQRDGIHGNSVKLDNLRLTPGTYVLETKGSSSFPFVTVINIADKENMPEYVDVITSSNLPEKIKQGYIALVLSGYEEWRFQALQIAEKYQLDQLKQDIRCALTPNIHLEGHNVDHDLSTSRCEVKLNKFNEIR